MKTAEVKPKQDRVREGGSPTRGNSPEGTGTPPGENRKILIMGREPYFSETAVDYAINLAERLGYDLIAMNVGSESASQGFFHSPYRRFLKERFKMRARSAAGLIAARAREKGLAFEHLVKFGELNRALEELNQAKRRIEFVINASEMSEAEMTGGVTLPVFTITGDQGESIMAKETGSWGMKQVAKTAAYGVATAVLYAAVFLNSDSVMNYFTRGGWYAALPVLTVFAFSFVHGAFSHHVWDLLGIHATQKTVQPRPTAAQRPARRQRPRPRLRLNV